LYFHRMKTGRLAWWQVLVVGLGIHALMLLLQLALPAGRGFEIVPRIAVPVLTVYPFGMLLVARLMLDQEERYAREHELEKLNASLERMVDERTEELQAANEELEQTNADLAKALAAIEAASESKSAFLRAMSHELRTPLNSVIGFADLLASGLAGPLTEEQARQVGMIQSAGRHLLALVNQTLDLARIEAGHLELTFDDVDACQLAREAVDTLRPEAEAKGLAIDVVTPDAPLILRTDRTRVFEIVTNLVSNAVKFTEAGSVTVAAASDGDFVTIAVTDTGPGIAPHDVERIFLEFVQGPDPSGNRVAQGAGLGLAISKRLAEALGGAISVESTPGAGSTFTLRLPLAPPQDEAQPK
ncbi:MAG: ATP-binding protein, partial [Coriobacteriia bacterium]|nr:ATP-binding protein [Coriobacteriia bacterium]